MKSLLFFGLFVFSFSLSAQDKLLTYDQCRDGSANKMMIYMEYTAKSGEVFKVGDRVTIGVPSHLRGFQFITQGDAVLTPIEPASASTAGMELEIKAIYVLGTKNSGKYACFRTKGGMFMTAVQIENALASGELKSTVMTSDQALAEIRKAKEMMELGLITPEEYEVKKAELATFIK